MEQQLDCALDLMRRLPPQKIEKNLADLIDLVCIGVLQVSIIVIGNYKIATALLLIRCAIIYNELLQCTCQ